MSPPKRTVFSLNLDTEAWDISSPNTDRVESQKRGPAHEHTDLTYTAKPFERIVNRTVNEFVDSTGKKLDSNKEGELNYSTETTSSSTGSGPLNIKNKSKRRTLERKYDTSEL
jgi:hypothetical protein